MFCGIVKKWKKTASFIAKDRIGMPHPEWCCFKECLQRGDYSTYFVFCANSGLLIQFIK